MLSVMMVLGIIIVLVPESTSLVASVKSCLTGIVGLLLLVYISLFLCIKRLFARVDKAVEDFNIQAFAGAGPKRVTSVIRTTALLLLCWAPYLFICFPTITRGYDYFWQLLQGMGVFPLSEHHPVFGSMVFGALFKVGYRLGGAECGLFFSTLVQMTLLALAISFGICSIERTSTIPKSVSKIMKGLFCFCPIYPGHAIWLIKDSLFTACAVLFFIQIYRHARAIINNTCIHRIASYPAIIIVGFVFSVYRNGVMPIAVGSLFVLLYLELITRKRNRRIGNSSIKRCCTAIVILILANGSWNMVMSAMDAYPTDSREALAMPARQIMRTLQLHPEELNTSVQSLVEEAYHDQISNGVRIEDIVSRYDSYNADPIKIDYVSGNDDFMKSYLHLWISLGVKHPGAYADAFFKGTDGYWNPFKSPHLEAYGTVIHTVCTEGPENDFANEGMRKRSLGTLFTPTVKSLESAGINTEQSFEDFCSNYPWLDELMQVKSAFPHARARLGVFLGSLENVPFLNMLLAPGTYFWIMLICLAYMFSRKKTGRYLWPILFIEVLAWLSPINGYTRYILPIEIISILMIGMCFEKVEMRVVDNKK